MTDPPRPFSAHSFGSMRFCPGMYMTKVKVCENDTATTYPLQARTGGERREGRHFKKKRNDDISPPPPFYAPSSSSTSHGACPRHICTRPECARTHAQKKLREEEIEEVNSAQVTTHPTPPSHVTSSPPLIEATPVPPAHVACLLLNP